jgi:hypothetical protein
MYPRYHRSCLEVRASLQWPSSRFPSLESLIHDPSWRQRSPTGIVSTYEGTFVNLGAKVPS